MAIAKANSSYEKVATQMSVAVGSIVFGMQMMDAGTFASALLRGFSTGLAVAMVLILAKVGFIIALRVGLTARQAPTAVASKPTEEAEQSASTAQSDAPTPQKPTRMAA